jgi:ATP-binding protein involved in chromosome partitioning
MKIAVPVSGGRVCMHFGHADEFALYDISRDGEGIAGRNMVTPPPHEPGLLPRWLHERGADVILAGGMGSRAQQLFKQVGVRVVPGVSSVDPDEAVVAYLSGILKTGANTCDH